MRGSTPGGMLCTINVLPRLSEIKTSRFATIQLRTVKGRTAAIQLIPRIAAAPAGHQPRLWPNAIATVTISAAPKNTTTPGRVAAETPAHRPAVTNEDMRCVRAHVANATRHSVTV